MLHYITHYKLQLSLLFDTIIVLFMSLYLPIVIPAQTLVEKLVITYTVIVILRNI